MLAAIKTQDYNLKQGSEWQIIIEPWVDKINGTLLTLDASDEFRMQLRSTIDSSTVILSLTSNPSAGITFNTGTSKVTVTITATQAAAITEKSMCYDLEYVPLANDANAIRWLQGSFKLSKEVTR
jgi:hypothetical protein